MSKKTIFPSKNHLSSKVSQHCLKDGVFKMFFSPKSFNMFLESASVRRKHGKLESKVKLYFTSRCCLFLVHWLVEILTLEAVHLVEKPGRALRGELVSRKKS